jgi:hypothetical protein
MVLNSGGRIQKVLVTFYTFHHYGCKPKTLTLYQEMAFTKHLEDLAETFIGVNKNVKVFQYHQKIASYN